MIPISWQNDIFVLIPAYKAAEDLKKFLPALMACMPVVNICVVDDGSFDATDLVCKELGVCYISHDVNKGKGAALKTGFVYLRTLKARWILTMDADGQHAVSDIALFLKAAGENPSAGIIVGARNFSLKTMPPERIFSNVVTSKALSVLCGRTIKDCQSGFRLYAADMLSKISIDYNRFEMESEVILKACALGLAIEFVTIQTLYCGRGSHISHVKDTMRWIGAVVKVWWLLRTQSHTNMNRKKNIN